MAAVLYRLLTGLLLVLLPGLPVRAQEIVPGACTDQYHYLLKGKRVALVVNQTSMVNGQLLPDTLLKQGFSIVKIFVPEHGFRGTADAGAHVANEVDARTGLPVISLYGDNKKPKKEQLQDVDVLVYDLQDVGVRFYTYISTLQYVMEACAENGKLLVILDRPDPTGFYVDGPVLDTSLRSFVGMQPVPVVYGMTPGEYAQMLVGEHWFPGAAKLNYKVIPCRHYDHSRYYELPVAPSPNLRTMKAVYNYPSLCLFEGTVISVGRGTNQPFLQWGHPALKGRFSYSFTPLGTTGASKPLYEGQACYGELMNTASLRQAAGGDVAPAGFEPEEPVKRVFLESLLTAYQAFPDKEKFFNSFFEKLAGTRELRRQVVAGMSADDIRRSWRPGLEAFKKIRKKYLLYKDFEP